MLISLISAKGSPGVTTATLALASRWPRRAVVVDADPLCGDMLAGVGGGRIPATTGLVELMVAARAVGVPAALPGQLVHPDGHCPPIVAGLGAPGQAAGVAWEQLSAGLAGLAWADALADCGRYGTAPTPIPMLAASELVVLVMGSSLRAVRAAERTVPVIRDDLTRAGGGGDHLVAVVVDPGRPYGETEIAGALGVAVLGVLPLDPAAAAVWSDGRVPPRSFDRSPLQRAATRLAAQLVALTERHRAWTADPHHLTPHNRPPSVPDPMAAAEPASLAPAAGPFPDDRNGARDHWVDGRVWP